MIWAILALLGVPLWFCAIAIAILLLRNRSLRKRAGNIPSRIRLAPDKRWTRGHGLWTHDVWAFRGSPAAWNEKLIWVTSADVRDTTEEETKKLSRLGKNPVVAIFGYDGGTIEVAASGAYRERLLGPYLHRAASSSAHEKVDVAPEAIRLME